MKRGNARGAKGVGHQRWIGSTGVGSTGSGRNLIINGRRQPSHGGTSRMMREYHVRICEGPGVQLPGSTRRCADRRAGTLGSRQTHEFSCSVARGPQPPRGGRRCQEPLDATLATLADALEAIGVNGCRPGRAADGRRRLSSFRKRVSYSAMIGRNPLVPRRCYGRSNSAMRGLVTGPSGAYGVRGSCALNSASTS